MNNTNPKNPKNPKKKLIIVLSMHRCGSSCCTGSLQYLGTQISYGKSLKDERNQWNEKGFFENEKTFRFHKRMLREFKTNWKTARDLTEKEHRRLMLRATELKEIISTDFLSIENVEVFVVKDPRITWIFDVYLKAVEDLGLELYVIHLDRPDDSISKSLSSIKPHRLTYKNAMNITKKYKKKIQECLKKVPQKNILYVQYSDILNNPVAVLTKVNTLINMPQNSVNVKGVSNFIDKRLKHY